MSLILAVNIEDLLGHGRVESARIEFKASWDEKTTGIQVLRTICAFANDFHNLNGGYIVIGVAEEKGVATRPVTGVDARVLDEIQQWIRGHCNQIDPVYQPVLSPETIDGRHVLVIWVPASDIRPHQAPDAEKGQRKFFVRLGSETVAAQGGILHQLIQMTARVPFDDRRAMSARIEDVRESKVREFLRDIGSGLLDEKNPNELYRKLRIAVRNNGHDVPRNIGLLLFSQEPEEWFRVARIEIVQFADHAAGNVIEEKVFCGGGIHEQLRNALQYLEHISSQHLEKQAHSFLVKGWVSYPIQALREALVNAVYHRGYEEDTPEPIKIHLYPDRIEVSSYPGPVPGIELEHLTQKSSMPPVPARNRRIGEFLKELRLAEGRGTGLPKIFKAMRDNGSPDPRFDFNADRSYFRVTLPAHPEYVAISALRDAAHLLALGSREDAKIRIRDAWEQRPGSPALTAEWMRLLGKDGKVDMAISVFKRFESEAPGPCVPHVSNVLMELLLNEGMEREARELLGRLPHDLSSGDALDAAILSRRLGKEQVAHRYFEKALDVVLQDPRSLLEFAQTKIKLAKEAHRKKNRHVDERFLKEAKELLERVLQMEASDVRHAWAWRELGRVKRWLKLPMSEVEAAYRQAIALSPNERMFQEEMEKLPKSQD
ncbi:MAG: putative DNA binding domain-containing protein [Magnetococcales bacterium]|nr:putative DNA binding domain-containing protein [Magnetococcales bacterium]